MEFTFYISAIVAAAATIRVITCSNAVHALLYLIVSLLAVAVIFYAFGAPFSATLEVIVYAGAVVVLFVFVVMMLNLNIDTIERERLWLAPRLWIGPSVLAVVLLVILSIALAAGGGGLGHINGARLSAKAVGMQLYGPYLLVTELAAFLLLSALAVAAHVGRDDREIVKRAETGERFPPK